MEVLTLLTDKLQHQTLNDVKGFDNDMLQNVDERTDKCNSDRNMCLSRRTEETLICKPKAFNFRERSYSQDVGIRFSYSDGSKWEENSNAATAAIAASIDSSDTKHLKGAVSQCLSESSSSSTRLSNFCALSCELKSDNKLVGSRDRVATNESFVPFVDALSVQYCYSLGSGSSSSTAAEPYSDDELELIERCCLQGKSSRKRMLSDSVPNVFTSNASSDDEVTELLATCPAPLAKEEVAKLFMVTSVQQSVVGNDGISVLSPRKRHCQTPSVSKRDSLNQRPSLDFDKMQRMRRCSGHSNGGSRVRIVKIRAFSGSPQPTKPLHDPAVFAFRSISSNSSAFTSPVDDPIAT